MPTLDTASKAAVASAVIAPAFFVFLDIAGDPIRVTTYAAPVTPSGAGDADLDGQTFSPIDPRVLNIGNAAHSEDGSDTLEVELSGIVTIDTALLNEIGSIATWRGRTCRLWVRFFDLAAGDWAGGFVPYYTGYMWGVDIAPSPTEQIIKLKVENYLATYNSASNRTYQGQKDFDPTDVSAAASISSANSARAGGSFSGGGGGGYAGMPGFDASSKIAERLL